ncbi:sigma-70 family RNA polymerase sigma factor [Cellulomonas sp. P22]|uniref:sigma-70 family RNA polymerase sigma factor n=1 Tax=Cellulomonas sp. P22 TaxID=3373189 RepID=UPI003797B2B1
MGAASSEAPLLGDAELITAARGGDADAYGVLYERHAGATWAVARQYTNSAADAEDVVAEAFTKVFAVLRSGGGPDVAFRAYIFTTARRLGMQRVQGARRVEATDDLTVLEVALDPELSTESPALADFERGVVAQAYRTLPERWQAVLWYTEVEAMPPAQIGPLLGLSANGVAALAYRAREGLRQAYLQQHLQEPISSGCRTIAGKLGAYVRDGLAARETAQVEQHLESCGDCRALLLELGDVNHGMRAVIAPLVLGVLGVGALAQPLPVGGGIAAGAAALGGGAAGVVSSAAGVASGGASAGASAGVATSATGAVSSSAVASTGAGAVVAGAGAGATTAATGVVAASAGGIAALLGSAPLAVVGIAAAALVAVAGVAVAGVLGVFSGGGPDEASDISSIVEATATATPDVSTSPMPTPSASTESATPTPTVSQAPQTATPTATPSVRPSVAPAAVAEPAPTPTATPTATPEPTVSPQPAPSPSADPTTPPTRAPARLSLQDDSGPVVLVADGEVQSVGVDITNLGEVDATGLVAVVTLPAGTEVAGTPAQLVAARTAAVLPAGPGRFAAVGAGGAWVCVGEEGATSATCSLTRLDAGATATLSLPVVVDEEASGSDDGYVGITVSGDGLAPQQLRAEIRVQRQARLDVSAPVDRIDLVEGQQGEVQVRVANSGDVAARSVRVVLTRPEGTVWADDAVWADDPVEGDGWACEVAESTATCTRATIPAGGTADLVLRLRAAAGVHPGPLASGVRVEATAASTRAGGLDVPVDVRGSRLAFGDAPVVQLVEGRTGRVAFTVTSSGNHPADAVTALVSLPAHVRAELGGTSGSTTGCTAVSPRLVSCDLGTLDPGAVVPVVVGARALGAGSGDVVVTVSGGTGDPVTGRAPAKVASGGLSPRFVSEAGWAVTQVGAPLLTCTDGVNCTRALAGTASLDNNGHVMRPLNAAGGAYVSSSTQLDAPADREIAFAGLYWSANRGSGDVFRGDLECVRLRAPGEKTYTDVEGEVLAEVTDDSGRTYYQSFADVTDQVRAGGAGTWALADAAVAATRRDPVPTYYAGWALVVVYAEVGTGTATVYDGGAWVGSRPSDAPSFTFAAEVGATARIGVVAWEGDRGTTGDQLRLNGTALTWRSSGAGPGLTSAANNAFDSTATGWSQPNSLGVDVKAFGDTVLTTPLSTLTPTTTGDQYLIGAVTVQTR